MKEKLKECRRCGRNIEVKMLPEKHTHYAEYRCSCGKHEGYEPYPQNKGKRPPNRHSPEGLGIDYCQMCQRHKERLGNRETLHSHHVIEVGTQGGEDVPENIWVVCTPCHRYIHHQRTYLNNHLTGKYSFEDLEKDLEKDGVPVAVRETIKRIYKKQEALHVRLRN